MTKYRESKAPVTTSTYNRNEIEKGLFGLQYLRSNLMIISRGCSDKY